MAGRDVIEVCKIVNGAEKVNRELLFPVSWVTPKEGIMHQA